ncbi:MAG TPA: hypothetical protein VLB85_00375 [Acidimicrobiia bacterium]|nr:hypothetical protein [Acidimicrobiia bacterium]
MTSTIERSFTGTLDIGGQPVTATIRFGGGEVSLLVGNDAVGTWRSHEIAIVPEGQSYELQAEGDSISFLPDDTDGFQAHLTDPEPPAATDEPDSGVSMPETVPSVEFDPPGPAPVGHEPFDLPPDPIFDAPLPAQASLFRESTEENEPLSDLSPSFVDEGDEPEPAISWDSQPDELYAAGLNGSPGDFTPSPFRSAVVPTPPPPVAPVGAEGADAADRAGADPEEPTWEQPRREATTGIPAPGLSDPVTPPADDLPSSVTPPADDLPEPAATDDVAEADAGHVEPVVDPSSGAEPAATDAAAEIPGGPATGRGAAVAGFARNVIAAFRDRSNDETVDTDVEESEDGGFTPQPIDDHENLRQWGLVLAGGLVLLALIAMVVWGLASMLGSDDPLEAAVETTPTVPTTAAPLTTTTTTTPPVTTISPENEAAASGFVESWNRLATQYAYHLSISADSLPISVAPAPTVHLTYDENGVLGLKMVPKGTGSDRDLLLAMGLAVAWGDPALSPEGRKEVLGAMGVDVDDPELEEMGGSVSRNGVSYEATVSEGLIEFRVAPEA